MMLAVFLITVVLMATADEVPVAGESKCYEAWPKCTMDAPGANKKAANFMNKHGQAECTTVIRPDSIAASTTFPDIVGKTELDVNKFWGKKTKKGTDWEEITEKPAEFTTKAGNLLYVINHPSKAKICEKVLPPGKGKEPVWQEKSEYDVNCICIQQQKEGGGQLHLIVPTDKDLVPQCEAAGCIVTPPAQKLDSQKDIQIASSANDVWYSSSLVSKVTLFGVFLVGGLVVHAVLSRKKYNNVYTELVVDEI